MLNFNYTYASLILSKNFQKQINFFVIMRRERAIFNYFPFRSSTRCLCIHRYVTIIFFRILIPLFIAKLSIVFFASIVVTLLI